MISLLRRIFFTLLEAGENILIHVLVFKFAGVFEELVVFKLAVHDAFEHSEHDSDFDLTRCGEEVIGVVFVPLARLKVFDVDAYIALKVTYQRIDPAGKRFIGRLPG